MSMGGFMSATATILLFGPPVTDVPYLALVDYTLAIVRAGSAATSGIGGYCIDCRKDEQFVYLCRLGVV